MDRWTKESFDLVFMGESESGKAAKFECKDGETIWLPLSLIEYDPRATENEWVDVEMPQWLAEEKGLL